MAIEFHVEPGSGDEVQMYLDDVTVPGVYRAQEIGGGITEKYKAEVENRSGGQDQADEPPAARIEIEAYITEDTWEQLNELRDRQEPFEVQIGPFAFEEMGIRDMEAVTRAEETNSTQLNLTVQEFREVIIQERNLFDQGGDGSGDGSGGSNLENMDAQGPGAAWVDEDGDGRDDNTDEEIPNMETIPLSPGQEWQHNVGSGEAWGRKVLDSSEGRALPMINTEGQNWAVQDIGIRGEIGTPSRNYSCFGLTENGGESIVKNIYIADGAPMYNGDRGSTAMWVDKESTGQITFQYINVQNFPDNGIYGSAPGNSADILITDSYGANNGHGNFRLAHGRVESTVSVLDGSGHSANGPRCIWAWSPGPVELEDCDLVASGGGNWNAVVAHANNQGSTVNLSNCGVEGVLDEGPGTINESGGRQADPQNYHDNVPGSPADAASGVGGSGNDSGEDGGDES